MKIKIEFDTFYKKIYSVKFMQQIHLRLHVSVKIITIEIVIQKSIIVLTQVISGTKMKVN